MESEEVTFVHVYLTEGQGRLQELLECLHDEEKVRGVTVFRGVTGFGHSGRIHSATLLDMSLDLPLVIEFFDTPEKVERVLEHLSSRLEPGRLTWWPARVSL
ncbi:MAG: DUF190 domain-containing protein [Gammaproteobacteria bacterium]